MMFFSKFCRKNGDFSSHHERGEGRHMSEINNGSRTTRGGISSTSAVRARVSFPISHEADISAAFDSCNPLPATPPPSYSPRHSDELGIPGQSEAEGYQQQHRTNVPFAGQPRHQFDGNNVPLVAVLTSNPSERYRYEWNTEVAPQISRTRHNRQSRPRRRRRSSSSNSSTSSSSRQTSCEYRRNFDEDFNKGHFYTISNPPRATIPSQTSHVYCPDLLNACSLILTSQQRAESDSSIGGTAILRNSNTHRQSDINYSSDYAEINEIRTDPVTLGSNWTENEFLLLSHTQAKSNPELSHKQLLSSTTIVGPCISVNSGRGKGNDGDDEDKLNPSDQLQAMGQNLSLRRPRISLTWVLREQQQQQQHEPNQQSSNLQNGNQQQTSSDNTQASHHNHQSNSNVYSNGDSSKIYLEKTTTTTTATKKKFKIKQNGNSDKCNVNATTNTIISPEATHPLSEKNFSNHNLQEHQDKREPSKDLMFVCTPQRQPNVSYSAEPNNDSLALVKRRHEIKKKFVLKMATLSSSGSRNGATTPCADGKGNTVEKEELKSLKGTYSEPSLIAASEGNQRRHRHRKRRERNRVQKFGYEIRNVDEFLSKCSLASPGNIPVVLSTSSTLYQTRPGGYQIEIPLPLGMVVNAVFKNQNWLYVQTPHAEEGYVGYASCLPLGILPPSARSSSTSKPPPCWENNTDVFPQPCGNLTDSEKEIRLRGGTRSDGARTPRGKRSNGPSVANAATNTTFASRTCEEHHVDKLYLRAASQPKLTEKAYAQLKSTKSAVASSCNSSMRLNDEYVVLQQQQRTKLAQKHQLYQQQQHYIVNPVVAVANVHDINFGKSLRQTLVAINCDYATESITVHKGEIVTLCECRESRDHRQWFYVKTRDGREGYIPAEVAGHGFL